MKLKLKIYVEHSLFIVSGGWSNWTWSCGCRALWKVRTEITLFVFPAAHYLMGGWMDGFIDLVIQRESSLNDYWRYLHSYSIWLLLHELIFLFFSLIQILVFPTSFIRYFIWVCILKQKERLPRQRTSKLHTRYFVPLFVLFTKWTFDCLLAGWNLLF